MLRLPQLFGWRHHLIFHWHTWDKGNLIFFTVLPLPFVLLGGLFHFAYKDHLRIENARQRHADLLCLAENVHFEARGEPMAGQYAVAEVTLNRVASPLFPATVCDVVHEKRWDAIRKRHVGAFSWTELESTRSPTGAAWERALAVATAVYDGEQPPRVDGALFYHADRIRPSWARQKKRVAEIGRHVFYE